MRQKSTLLVLAIFSAGIIQAQQYGNAAYAITSAHKGGMQWNEVRKIDLATGSTEQVIYDQPAAYRIFSARTGKKIMERITETTIPTDPSLQPLSTYVAACAYDRKSNRLYYTPMFLNQLRYIDLSAKIPSLYFFLDEKFSTAEDLNNEANHITRMTIGADGNGYAISNDGNHFIRFTTGKQPVITDLGALQDDESNGYTSVHNRGFSWGGDMVASEDGDLYLFSASHKIFRIDISSKRAFFLGTINGLPEGYSTNGAVVDGKGIVIVSSAQSVNGYYKINMKTFIAEKLDNKDMVFNASDLANANLLRTEKTLAGSLLSSGLIENKFITAYPNPVTENMFRVSFNKQLEGRYDIQLMDVSGKLVAQKPVLVGAGGQVAEMQVNPSLTKGIYMVKVLGTDKKTVYSTKIMVH